MKSSFQLAIDILDEGLRLYRKGFVGFIQITAIWVVPVIIGSGISIGAVEFLAPDTALLLAFGFGWLLLFIPLLFYLVGGLSHAALMVQQGQRINVRKALTISPLRITAMGCYGTVFFLFANLVSWGVSVVCVCPAGLFFTVMMGSLVSLGSGETGAISTTISFLLLFLLIFILLLSYVFSLAVSGATYSSLVYALQPFIQEKLSLRQSIERSINLTFYRLGQNLLAFVLASFLFLATALSVSVTVGVLLPLPLFWALGSESLFAQGGSIVAWFLGLIVVVPPMPIWMMLLYQRNLAAYHGNDLADRIAAATADPTHEHVQD